MVDIRKVNVKNSFVQPQTTLAVKRDDGAVNAKPSGDAGAAPLNPRLSFDSRAGVVVTQFLNTRGDVQAQTPSNAVLAYLRTGLSADGNAVKDKAAKQDEENKDAIVKI